MGDGGDSDAEPAGAAAPATMVQQSGEAGSRSAALSPCPSLAWPPPPRSSPPRLRKDGLAVHGGPPPSPLALPIIGNLHQLGRGHHHRKLQALARRHGPLFLLRLGSVPTLVVSSPSLADAMLRAQDHVFCSRPQPHTARGTLYGCRDMAFGAYGERWRQLRRIAVLHLLSARRVDSFRSLRQEEARGFVERIRAAASAREEGVVNVTELVISLTNTVVSKAAFGNRLGGMEPGMVRGMMKELTELLGVIAVSDVLPRLGRWVDWATGLDARARRTAAELDSMIERALVEHEASRGGDDGSRSDLVLRSISIACQVRSILLAGGFGWVNGETTN